MKAWVVSVQWTPSASVTTLKAGGFGAWIEAEEWELQNIWAVPCSLWSRARLGRCSGSGEDAAVIQEAIRHHPGGARAWWGQFSSGSMAFSHIQDVLFTLLVFFPRTHPIALLWHTKGIKHEIKLYSFFLWLYYINFTLCMFFINSSVRINDLEIAILDRIKLKKEIYRE